MPSTVLVNGHGDVGLRAVATASCSSSAERVVRAGKPAPAGIAGSDALPVHDDPQLLVQRVAMEHTGRFLDEGGVGAHGRCLRERCQSRKSSSRALKRCSHMK